MLTWRYHKTFGAHIFNDDELPDVADGWVDSPELAEKAPIKRGRKRPVYDHKGRQVNADST